MATSAEIFRKPADAQHPIHDLIRERWSPRAFSDQPIEKEKLHSLFEAARWAASGGNLQPWFVYVLTGASLEEFRASIRAKLPSHPRGEGHEYDVYPKVITEPYLARRFTCGEDLYATIKVPREDKAARIAQFARNYELFDAPVGLFFAIDRQMGFGQWADLGMFMQNIMLLAREFGLHTCAQEAWAAWYKSVGEFLQLPRQLMLFCGMALGYRDESAPINRLRTARAELNEFAVFCN